MPAPTTKQRPAKKVIDSARFNEVGPPASYDRRKSSNLVLIPAQVTNSTQLTAQGSIDESKSDENPRKPPKKKIKTYFAPYWNENEIQKGFQVTCDLDRTYSLLTSLPGWHIAAGNMSYQSFEKI